MPNPAAIEDVESRWQPLTPQQALNAATFLDDAWWMLLSRRPTLEADITAGLVSSRNVVRVVATMVLRVLKNPDGYEQESLDDWSGRRVRLLSDGLLHVTSEELADITPGRRTRRSLRVVSYGDA